MKKSGILIGVVATILVLPPLIVPLFIPWSEINCRHEDINIKNGQARYSRCVWYMQISSRVEDTPLSLALGGSSLGRDDVESWHHANTFSPGVHHSPHYRFHAALWQAHTAGVFFEMLDASPERRREISANILKLWQQSGDYGGAGEYLHKLMSDYDAQNRRTGDAREGAGTATSSQDNT
jgi:hypothetical protein